VSFTISKRFEFAASHQLTGLPKDHQCARLHGHNYVVEVELAGDRLDATDFVLDYGKLAPVKAWIDDNLDHRHLNDVSELIGVNPTAERLAEMLHDVVTFEVGIPAGVSVAVGVSETPKTWAWYRP
jgi:6-pyruvoyltetrahydropterin/6-carboxytetrahydropterin synthase